MFINYKKVKAYRTSSTLRAKVITKYKQNAIG